MSEIMVFRECASAVCQIKTLFMNAPLSSFVLLALAASGCGFSHALKQKANLRREPSL